MRLECEPVLAAGGDAEAAAAGPGAPARAGVHRGRERQARRATALLPPRCVPRDDSVDRPHDDLVDRPRAMAV